MQLQQKRCPHSVAQLSVLSSRHNVQFLPALSASGMDETSSIVRSSSSAGFAGSPSGSTGPRNMDTGRSSRKVSRVLLLVSRCFPLTLEVSKAVFLLRNMTSRWSSRTPSKMPSSEYDGGRICGSWGIDDTCKSNEHVFSHRGKDADFPDTEKPLHEIVVRPVDIKDGQVEFSYDLQDTR